MPTATKSLPHLYGNILCAIDTETTGRMPGFHEIIQIAIQPLDSNLEPMGRPFYHMIAPDYPERSESSAQVVHGIDLNELKLTALDQWKVADLLDEWLQALDMPHRKSLVPLAHNWAFEAGFLKAWLGIESFNEIFHPHPRDSMGLAISLNDLAAFRGDKPVFPSVGLGPMCKQLGIQIIHAHDALGDALAEAQVYARLLRMLL
jgi:DNA polymerase III epsilon subunit-like protein